MMFHSSQHGIFLKKEEKEWCLKDDCSEMKKGDSLRLKTLKRAVLEIGTLKELECTSTIFEVGMNGEIGDSIDSKKINNANGSITFYGEGFGFDLERISEDIIMLVSTISLKRKKEEKVFSRLFIDGSEKRMICSTEEQNFNNFPVITNILLRDFHEHCWTIFSVFLSHDKPLINFMKEKTKNFFFLEILDSLKKEIRMKELELEMMDSENFLENAVSIHSRAEHLDKCDVFGKSDPYFFIKTIDRKKIIYESEVVDKTLNPVWEKGVITDAVDSELIVEVYDWDGNSDDDLIGIFKFRFEEIKNNKKFEIINEEKKRKKKKYKNSGCFVFEKYEKGVLVPNEGFIQETKKIQKLKEKYEVVKKNTM